MSVTIQRDRDWELLKHGVADQQRHRRKIKEALRENPERVLRDQNVIGADRKKKVKVPFRALKEYRIRYAEPGEDEVGQGDGDSQEGDTIIRKPEEGETDKGEGGEGRGETVYEIEISVKELKEIVFEELELPDLEDRGDKRITNRNLKYESRSDTGLLPNLDKKEMMKENLKRNISKGEPGFGNFHNDDLRFRQYTEKESPESNAVIFLLRDASGSMSSWKKYVSRSMGWWLVEFLRTQYENLDIEFLLHTTQPEEVEEEDFFKRAESGGTRISPVYKLMLTKVENYYPVNRWNVYGFHFSDGQNQSSDNEAAIKKLKEICDRINHFGFSAIANSTSPRNYFSRYRSSSGVGGPFAIFSHPDYAFVKITEEDQISEALYDILEKEGQTNQ